MKKYFRIYRRFIENALSYQAQYRKDTFIQVSVMMAWVAMLLLSVDIIFQHTTTLGGWQKEELYLLTLLWTISYELATLIYRRAMNDLPDTITEGNLDPLLTKPVNSIFLVTLHRIELRSLYTILLQIGLVIWLANNYDIAVSTGHIFLAGMVMLCSGIVQFSLYLIANTFSFWLLRIDNINDAVWAIQGLGKYPLNIYPSIVSFIFLFCVPVGFMAYVPVSMLTGIWPWWWIILPITVSIIIFSIAIAFWRFAITRYSSASS